MEWMTWVYWMTGLIKLLEVRLIMRRLTVQVMGLPNVVVQRAG